MKYLGTSFSITLGAWRVRFSLYVEDAPDDRPVATANRHHIGLRDRTRERAQS